MIFTGLLFLGLVALGVPVVVALALAALLGVAATEGLPLAVVATRTASASDNFILLAIPLFALTGSLMSAGGIGRRLFDFARVLVGHTTSGLAQVNVALSVFNGGLQGSSAADAAIDCKVTIPQMRAQGYPAAFSAAVTAVSGMLSNILPPSIAMLIYASIANTSVGKLFVAGFVPGLLMALAMSTVAHLACLRRGYGRRTARASWREIAGAFRQSAFALTLPLIIIGGIRLGYFTPTEAGAVAVIVTFVLGAFVYRELRMRDLPGILAKTALDTGVIMMIISLSSPLSWILAYHQVPQHVAAFFVSLGNSVPKFLVATGVFLLIAGCFLEGVTLLILVTPILAGAAARLGIDPIHFGMVVIVTVVLGAVTPPFGQLVFFVSSLIDVPPEAIFREVFQFLPLLLVVLAVIMFVPQSYLWTVRLFGP
ncbi:MAG: TRAP transporter large permease [Armatimonadota bacterium]|nr:TRAP transporter large permease [Armatimonadota bacterium]MDR7450632.1 TRAP transporter large permease [Armatimonadota bacterium]MDR7466235.1 TRAP transporter large permease [Armatimonadota bacterium]MDR7492956.1 TRAP transporter large permease [Armatimonadota bacterium]MDR7498287.1 TRAP transporter large permease [Armatimonadota bacterium]